MMLNKDKLDIIIFDMEAEINDKLKRCKPYSPKWKSLQAQLDILNELVVKIEDI